ncbi:MAG: HAD hydrolase-like protein, partial [Chloroflexi bacterium]|nr:HAD hydrolase-like protein [Chloroflexota bacterium]
MFESIVHEQRIDVRPSDLFERWTVHEAAFRARRVTWNTENGWRTQEPFVPYGVAWAACFVSAMLDLDAGIGDPGLAAQRVVEDLKTRRLYPEVAVALDTLRARVPLGIVSNADDAFLSAALAHNGLVFDLVVYSEAERIYKPDPR